MNYEPPINVPEIQSKIKEIHNKFIKDFASHIDKVQADHKLLADILLSRIFRVSVCFKEEGIIDIVHIVQNGPCKKIKLQKNNYDNYIYILTNGKQILLEGFGYTLDDFTSDYLFGTVKFNNIDSNFDWTDFAIKLLDYIHLVIYERKEALESKLDGSFRDISE